MFEGAIVTVSLRLERRENDRIKRNENANLTTTKIHRFSYTYLKQPSDSASPIRTELTDTKEYRYLKCVQKKFKQLNFESNYFRIN